MKRGANTKPVTNLLNVALYWWLGMRQRREEIVISIRSTDVVLISQVVHLLPSPMPPMHGYLRMDHISNHHGLLMHHFRPLQQSLFAPSRYSTRQKRFRFYTLFYTSKCLHHMFEQMS